MHITYTYTVCTVHVRMQPRVTDRDKWVILMATFAVTISALKICYSNFRQGKICLSVL